MTHQTRTDLRAYWLVKAPVDYGDNRAIYDECVTGAWRDRGDELCALICHGCGGGRAARLGSVADTDIGPVLAVEIVYPPKAAKLGRRPWTAFDLGWHRRGRPDASQRLFWMDDWDDNDFVGGPVYCPKHGMKVLNFGEVRDYLARHCPKLVL